MILHPAWSPIHVGQPAMSYAVCPLTCAAAQSSQLVGLTWEVTAKLLTRVVVARVSTLQVAVAWAAAA